MKSAIKTAAAVSVLAGSLAFSGVAQAADTIKVGILHSLSGTMAISETALRDVVLFTQTISNVITYYRVLLPKSKPQRLEAATCVSKFPRA
jgi:multidrug transporter EmrE-like cation transporter